MYCHTCGARLPQALSYCNHCGANLGTLKDHGQAGTAGTATSTRNTVDSAASRAHGALDQAGNVAATKASAAAEGVLRAAHGVVDKAAQAAAPATAWLGDKEQAVRDAQQQLNSYVNENPVKALLIAFAAGVFVGKIIL